MKKAFARTLAILALAALLTGCRGGNTPAATTVPTTATQPTTMATTEATTTATTQEATEPTVDNGNGPLETTEDGTGSTTAPANAGAGNMGVNP